MEEQLITMLKDAQGGIGAPEIFRNHGISDATFYTWRRNLPALKSVT
ncbi:MAG: hypothetical protein P0111_07510 [Nitrospira sp.]|nr:hypothetical protein [Nitrospira sp.]